MHKFILILSIFLAFRVPVISQDEFVPTKVASISTFAEAPVFDTDGNLYVSEPYGGPIHVITPQGKVAIWANLDGANGHKILSDGTHLVCERVRKLILRLDADGNVIGEAAAECGGNLLRAPNDIVLDKQGGFYFTDPGNEEDPVGRIGYVDTSGTSHLVDEISGYPNGIALAPNGELLYVADFSNNKILVYPIHAPAEVGPKELYTELPDLGEEFGGPDGILCDETGNLFIAHLGTGKIQVIDPEGKLIRSLPAGQLWVSNLTLGGPEGKTLYMTGSPKGQTRETGVVYKLDISEGMKAMR